MDKNFAYEEDLYRAVYPPEIAAVLMVISTLIDIPATLLNSTGNVVASVLVNKLSPEK